MSPRRSSATGAACLTALAALSACSAPDAARIDASRPIRIAVRASGSTSEISSLSYKGGFEPKTFVYETLVKRDANGRIAPELAASWRFEDGGRQCVLELRPNARFHDGSPVTAAAVREHFQRWVGLPEHDWLACNQHIVAVRAEGPSTLRIVMDEPRSLLPDLCAINPCAIRAPSTLDFEGNFVEPVGSGPFRWEGLAEGGRVLHYSLVQRHAQDGLAVSRVDLVRFVNESPDEVVDQVLDGRLDVVADGWRERIPRDRIDRLRHDPRVRVVESPGSSVVSLGFKLEGGPCADLDLRRTIRGILRRADLVGRVEHGFADACSTFAAPSVAWPGGPTHVDPPPDERRKWPALRLLCRANSDYQPALTKAIADELRHGGFRVDVVSVQGDALARVLESGAYDMRIETTWGVPYDPDISLGARFGAKLDREAAATPNVFGQDARLTGLVLESQREYDEDRRARVFERIQARIDEIVALVPLYVPRRFAVFRADLAPPVLDHDLYRIDAASMAPATVVRQP